MVKKPDIRDRNILARASFDPRYDKLPTTAAPLASAVSALTIGSALSMPAVRPEAPSIQPAVQQPLNPVTAPVVPRPTPAVVRPASQITPPSVPSSSGTIITGDSVATGIGYNGARGNNTSEAQWGRSSAAQLAFMQRRGPNYYRNKNVILSSGVLNSGDLKSVEAQLKFLKSAGASSVRLAGAPLAGQYSHLNKKLKELAARYGVHFIGGYDSQDGIHPRSYTNYR